MFEKVNPSHPDKVADRIAGAIVDYAYNYDYRNNPRIAVEVLIGHGTCNVIIETSEDMDEKVLHGIVRRIGGEGIRPVFSIVKQDPHLSHNQEGKVRCGDNGIFKGIPVSGEEWLLSNVVRSLYDEYPYDGKFIVDGDNFIACQSNCRELPSWFPKTTTLNPLGYWTGGTDVDTGATNRKLGSDMAQSVTGGGLHGKDLSKADVSLNIWCWCEAQRTGEPVELCCAIGDELVDGRPYSYYVDFAREYISEVGGFEKFAEWGLV